MRCMSVSNIISYTMQREREIKGEEGRERGRETERKREREREKERERESISTVD